MTYYHFKIQTSKLVMFRHKIIKNNYIVTADKIYMIDELEYPLRIIRFIKWTFL